MEKKKLFVEFTAQKVIGERFIGTIVLTAENHRRIKFNWFLDGLETENFVFVLRQSFGLWPYLTYKGTLSQEMVGSLPPQKGIIMLYCLKAIKSFADQIKNVKNFLFTAAKNLFTSDGNTILSKEYHISSEHFQLIFS